MTLDLPLSRVGTLGTRRYEHALVELAEADERLVVMTAENRAMLRGMPGRLGPRFIDTGITEQTLVGAAAGLALRGRIPIVHALAAFLTMRAFEFIRTDVGLAGLPVKLVGFVPGFLSDANGPTHQAIEDVALMRQIPGMRVFCPADGVDLISALPTIVADPHPWYIRYLDRPAGFAHQRFRPGVAEVVREGDAAVLLTYGLLVTQAIGAADLLAEQGVAVRVVHLRTLDPIDETALVMALDSPLVVTIEDHQRTGGLASILAETALRRRVTGRHLSLAIPDGWFTPTLLPQVLTGEGFTPEQIAERVLTELDLIGGEPADLEPTGRGGV